MFKEFRVRPAGLYSAMGAMGLLKDKELTERGVVVLLAALLKDNGGKELRLSNASLTSVYQSGAFIQMSDGAKDGEATGEVVLTLMPYQNRRPLGVSEADDTPDMEMPDIVAMATKILQEQDFPMTTEPSEQPPSADENVAAMGKVLQFKPRKGKME